MQTITRLVTSDDYDHRILNNGDTVCCKNGLQDEVLYLSLKFKFTHSIQPHADCRTTNVWI